MRRPSWRSLLLALSLLANLALLMILFLTDLEVGGLRASLRAEGLMARIIRAATAEGCITADRVMAEADALGWEARRLDPAEALLPVRLHEDDLSAVVMVTEAEGRALTEESSPTFYFRPDGCLS